MTYNVFGGTLNLTQLTVYVFLCTDHNKQDPDTQMDQWWGDIGVSGM